MPLTSHLSVTQAFDADADADADDDGDDDDNDDNNDSSEKNFLGAT